MIPKYVKRLIPRTRNARIAAAIGAVPLGVVVLLLLIFGFDRFLHRGEVLRNVTLAGVPLSGLDEDGVREAVADLETELTATPAIFIVNDQQFVLDPGTVSLTIDSEAVVTEAMATGRQGGAIRRLGDWLRQLRTEREVEFAVSIDDTALDEVFEAWEEAAIEARAFNGAVLVVERTAVAEYPMRGLAIDGEPALVLVLESLSQRNRSAVEIPLAVIEPALAEADIDDAVQEANLAITGDVELSRTAREVRSITFTQAQLAAALVSSFETDPPRMELGFDPVVIDQFLGPLRDELEDPPMNAEFRINDDLTVTLVPSEAGTFLDSAEVATELYEAALTPSRRGVLPVVEGAQPEFTTEAAEAMMPIELVSEFTTKHNCCENRVSNIQLMADMVDLHIVQPGETFSLNDFIGRRTLDKGFLNAPMIQGGELIDDVGGGVSQFATTMFNAVFWGGYEDIEHTPHSIYISRYPRLIEATMSWPKPDLVWRNNTDAIVIIDTAHTDTSITVRFFGNNDGLEVGSFVGEPFNFTEAITTYEANAEVAPGTEKIISGGSGGYTVTGKRILTYRDGSVVEENLTHRYRGELRKIEVHPCNMPGVTNVACPLPVPPLGGLTAEAAQATLAAAGFFMSIQGTVPVSAESGLNGVVAQMSEEKFADAGAVILVWIGEAPPAPSTTIPSTSTTTTTVP